MVSRETAFQSRDPSKIPSHVIMELICRLLVNLPPEEKEFPRILYNIKEACWFYADNFCPVPPEM